MDKKTYYIAVGPGEVMNNQGDASYEFEIIATEEDILKLQDLFKETDNASQGSFSDAYLPWKVYYSSESNQEYDGNLMEVYRTLHKLGTEETKRHIESMHILHGHD